MASSKRSSERESYWRLVVAEQRRSGLNIRAFCQRKAISEPSFYGWRKELRKRDGERAASADSGGGRLIAVEVMNPGGENERSHPRGQELNGPLEIGTPGGFTLRFDRDAAPETISRLLDVIARSPTQGAASC